jgi:hypothetical protein
MAFLLTISRRIKFVTAEHIPVRTALSLSGHMARVLEVYGWAGFRVRSILMDGEFEKLKPLMPSVECNTTAAKEHVRGRAYDSNPQEADERASDDTPVHPSPKEDEDQAHLLFWYSG